MRIGLNSQDLIDRNRGEVEELLLGGVQRSIGADLVAHRPDHRGDPRPQRGRSGDGERLLPHIVAILVVALQYLDGRRVGRSEEHTSELQSLMRISYAVFCLKKKKKVYDHYLIYHNNTYDQLHKLE